MRLNIGVTNNSLLNAHESENLRRNVCTMLLHLMRLPASLYYFLCYHFSVNYEDAYLRVARCPKWSAAKIATVGGQIRPIKQNAK